MHPFSSSLPSILPSFPHAFCLITAIPNALINVNQHESTGHFQSFPEVSRYSTPTYHCQVSTRVLSLEGSASERWVGFCPQPSLAVHRDGLCQGQDFAAELLSPFAVQLFAFGHIWSLSLAATWPILLATDFRCIWSLALSEEWLTEGMAVLGQAHREVFWVLSSKGMQPKLTALAPIRPHFEYFKKLHSYLSTLILVSRCFQTIGQAIHEASRGRIPPRVETFLNGALEQSRTVERTGGTDSNSVDSSAAHPRFAPGILYFRNWHRTAKDRAMRMLYKKLQLNMVFACFCHKHVRLNSFIIIGVHLILPG